MHQSDIRELRETNSRSENVQDVSNSRYSPDFDAACHMNAYPSLKQMLIQVIYEM